MKASLLALAATAVFAVIVPAVRASVFPVFSVDDMEEGLSL